MKTTSTRKHPVNPGFGFAEMMRQPDYSRFPKWYDTSSRLGGPKS